MEPIKNWNNVKPIGGEKQQLPAGGYVCKIIGAKTVLNRKNRQMLEVYVDIAHDDEYNGFFMDRYKDQADREKWPNAATIRINLPANTDTPEDYEKMAGRVKKFIQDVEESMGSAVFSFGKRAVCSYFSMRALLSVRAEDQCACNE